MIESISIKPFIQPSHTNFDEYLAYANDYKLNMEIASFAFAEILDGNYKAIIKDYKRKLKVFHGIISMHGAFHDLILHSRDKKIKSIAEKRIIQNLEIANELDCKYVVFHANYNPLISNKSYRINWMNANTDFWSRMIEKYHITILIENLWEPSPELFKELLKKVNSQFLKVCFDTGHANIFSKVPIEEWFKILKADIRYIHVNDNKGYIDSEMVPGKGNFNWFEFSTYITKYKLNPFVVFEVNGLENTSAGIKFFKKNKIYPCIH